MGKRRQLIEKVGGGCSVELSVLLFPLLVTSHSCPVFWLRTQAYTHRQAFAPLNTADFAFLLLTRLIYLSVVIASGFTINELRFFCFFLVKERPAGFSGLRYDLQPLCLQ